MLPKLESPRLIENKPYYSKMWEVITDAVGVPHNVCEIGTRFGFWTRGLLENVGVTNRIFCIDTWPSKRNFTFYARAWQHTLGNDAFSKAIPLRGGSSEWAGVIDEKFDLIYVDGDHHYAAVKNDAEKWWPKLRMGGLMLFHDCDYPDVEKAVEEFFADKNETPRGGRLGPKAVYWTLWAVKEKTEP